MAVISAPLLSRERASLCPPSTSAPRPKTSRGAAHPLTSLRRRLFPSSSRCRCPRWRSTPRCPPGRRRAAEKERVSHAPPARSSTASQPRGARYVRCRCEMAPLLAPAARPDGTAATPPTSSTSHRLATSHRRMSSASPRACGAARGARSPRALGTSARRLGASARRLETSARRLGASVRRLARTSSTRRATVGRCSTSCASSTTTSTSS